VKKLFFFTLVILFSLTTIVVNAQDKKTLNNNQKNPTAKEQIDISKLPPKIPVNSISSPYIHESQTDVVSGIAFTQTTGTYTAIAGTSIITAGMDDGSSTLQSIGFNFVYNGTVFTTYGANSNGYITLGAVPSTSYTALSSIPNTIAFCNRDGRTNGAVTYLLSGTAPNRVLTIQYPGWYLYYNSTNDQLNAQIKLYETTNIIEIVYGGTASLTSSYTPYVGINGSVTTDFSVRTTTTSWAATTAGATNTATMTWSPTVYPTSGQIYRWSPGVEIGTYPWKEYFNVWPPPNFNLTGGTQNWAQYISSTDSAAYCNFWNWTAGYYALMQTPLLNLTSGTGLTAPSLAFRWSHQYMSSYPTDSLGVYITTNSGTTWVGIWGLKGTAFNSGDGAGTTTPGTYVTANVDLTPYLNQRASIRFVGYSGYGPDVFISDVSVFNGGPPSVTTTTPSNINITTATGGGNVTLQGASPVTARGVCWSTTANPTTANSKTIDGSGTGVFTSSITGLSASTTYHVRAYATNTQGTSYGSDIAFTTLCNPSSVPWTENFDAVTIPSIPNCWKVESGPWVTSNAASNSYNDPRSAPNYMTIYYSPTTGGYVWSPGFTLTGGTSYDFSFYFAGDNVSGWTGNTYTNTSQSSSGATLLGSPFITSAIVSTPTYTLVTRTFTPGSSGTYYFGIYVTNTGAPWYLGFDDFSVTLTPSTPTFSITPLSKAFGSVTVGGGSVDQVFTITNTGGGALSINNGGISISGTDASQFLLIDNNSYPINLTNGQTAQVRVLFAPTSTGAKSANLHIDDNTGGHDIAITGTGILNAPQNLLGGLNASFLPSLSWQSPSPGAEIKIDDGSAESNMWVGSPSTTSQMFYDKFTSPHNGTISQIAVYTYAGSAGIMFNSVMLCPDDGTGKPNVSSPWASFNNVAVGTSYSWIFLTLLAPQNVTVGQTFYIVTQWPAGSTTGPYVGTDNTSPAGKSSWTQDGGVTWNAWAGNFFMRAYMGTYSDKLISGTPDPKSKMLPVKTTLITNSNNIKNEKKENIISVPAASISGKNGEKILSSYTLQRGSSSGSYDTQFPGLNSTTYDDVSATMGNTYYYVVQAIYTDGTSGYSNEVSVTALNPNFGTFATNLYKFSNSTPNGNPAPNQKPAFEWIPTTDFTPIAAFTGSDDDGYFEVDFPGQFFKFFGTDYSSVYVGTNGYITFGAGNMAYSPVLLPSAGAPLNMIAAAFKDLYVQRTYTPATNVSYKINPDNVIISYENIYDISGANGTNYISFQIILYTNTYSPALNSLFIINYNDDMSAAPLATNMIVTGASVGVNNGTGTAGYNYRFTGTKGPMFNGVGKSTGAMALGMVDNNAGTLPVKLSSFTNSVSGRDIILNWTTESENNNAGFEIYRKNHNDAEWSKISFVSGKGNSSGKSSYVFTDRKLNSGKYDYKLKQIDNNGNYTYYLLGGFVEVGVPAKYNLSQNYPNPFNPVTKIDYDIPFDSKVKLIVFDILGREVKNLVNGDLTKAGYYTAEFNATNLSSGAYFYRIIANGINGKDFIATKKMVIVK